MSDQPRRPILLRVVIVVCVLVVVAAVTYTVVTGQRFF